VAISGALASRFGAVSAEASGIAPYVDALYFFLVLMTIVGTTLVAVLLLVFSIRYRREKNPVATQVEGSTLLEATWTIIPLAIFLLTFVWERCCTSASTIRRQMR